MLTILMYIILPVLMAFTFMLALYKILHKKYEYIFIMVMLAGLFHWWITYHGGI
nr:MAG TPA: hypothetical protein [Caudoviricetes sp.]